MVVDISALRFDPATWQCGSDAQPSIAGDWQVSAPRTADVAESSVELGLRNKSDQDRKGYNATARVIAPDGKETTATVKLQPPDWAYVHYPADFPAPALMTGTYTVVWEINGGYIACDGFSVTAEPATPSQAQAPDQAPAAIPTEDLIAQVKATLPDNAFAGGLSALPLTVPQGSKPLWAVISTGLRNFELKPLPNHFVALYTHTDAGWQELARMDLDTQDGGPDAVDEAFTQQVQLDPSRVWLQVAGESGAHGGSYQLLSYDGTTLRMELNVASPSPGMGSVKDVNGDGKLDVVLDDSDPYVLCYACGARKTQFQVLTWDPQQARLAEVTLQPLEASQDDAAAKAADRAVELAKAGLWKDALAQIEQARQAAAQETPADQETLGWDYALIKLHTDAMAAQPLAVMQDVSPVVPLLNNVFYGDYGAAVDLLRSYKPEQIFSAQSPLTTDPMIANFVPDVSKRLTENATQALTAEPDLAAAYFLKGWGEYLADAHSAQAKADIAKAAALAPNDALYKGSAAVFH